MIACGQLRIVHGRGDCCSSSVRADRSRTHHADAAHEAARGSASSKAAARGAGGGVQEQLRHRAEAREQARRHPARQTEVQQQHDAAEAALPPRVGAARRAAAAGRPRHVLELPDHLPGAHSRLS